MGLLATVCIPGAAHGQTVAPSGIAQPADPPLPPEDSLETAYTLGMGTGVRAGAVGTSALAQNTSNMAAASAYHIEAFSQIIPGGGNTYWTIGSSVTDSSTSKKLALGTSFRGVFSGSDRRYKGWDWRTGVGIQAIKQLGIGLGVRWARMNAESLDDQPLAPSLDRVTLDASITITPLPWLKVAGLGYNLIKTRSSLAPQIAGGSVSLAPIDSVTIGGDILVDLSTFEKNELIGGAGFQFIAQEVAPLRIGFRRDGGRNLNQLTASAGFTKGKFGIEGALRQTLGSQKETYLLFLTRFAVQ